MSKIKNSIAIILATSIFICSLGGCGQVVSYDTVSSYGNRENGAAELVDAQSEENDEEIVAKTDSELDLDFFVFERIFDEYSIAYDTFEASIVLPDGTEIFGIGYSDYASYFEPEAEGKGYFPAGFIAEDGDFDISEEFISTGIEINNLSYNDDRNGFVLAYETDQFYEHCVIDGKYVKYGISDGKITYFESEYSRDICDESLGSLFSYDEGKYLLDSDVGIYLPISGTSLFEVIDYSALEAEVNRILEGQDFNFSDVDIQTAVYYAQDAVKSYLLSLQKESFLGCDVEELIKSISELDPMQCIRISPDGNVIINVGKGVPKDADELAKWILGFCCGLLFAGDIAIGAFAPFMELPYSAFMGAVIDAYLQLLDGCESWDDINWKKVAISALSATLIAWACPLGASFIAKSVGTKTGSELLSKLSGYGFSTISNAFVTGTTESVFAVIDGKSDDEVFDSFLTGAALGATFTAISSALAEMGHAGLNALRNKHPQNWLLKLVDGASKFIGEHQVHLKNEKLEGILAPKSVYVASKAGVYEYNRQIALTGGKLGGSYNEVKATSVSKYTEVHETPSYSSTGATESREKVNNPAIKMTTEDHRQTASFGNSKDAQQYRAAQKELINSGNTHDAIQMDIDDIHSKFGDKYDEGISQMLEYASLKGWW